MLCFWLLFEPCLGVADIGSPGSPRSADGTLRKKKSELGIYAQQLLAAETILGSDEKAALGEFFCSSLSQDPEQRKTETLKELLQKLDPQRQA